MTTLRRWLVAAALLAALAGCPPTFSLPPDAKLSCADSAECGTWVCDKGLCVDPATLSKKCATTADCDDGLFCTGVETCQKGFCVSSAPPCGSSFACLVPSCDEAEDACAVAPDHGRCKDGFYCNATVGCTEGKGCQKDGDDAPCQDGVVCNGAERCSSFQCVPGPAAATDDGNPCTVDFCAEPDGPGHLPDPLRVREPCDLGDGVHRVCSDGGECVESICGDLIVDDRAEGCDDGNDDPNDGCHECRITHWAPEIVTGLGRHQGRPERLTIYYPQQLAVGRDGAVYVPDYWGDRVWQLEPGRAFVAAGQGTTGLLGDGGPAPAAQLSYPISVTVDGQGNLYVADRWNDRIRRVDASTRRITTLAGGGTLEEDGALAGAAAVHGPVDLVVDGLGNVFYIDVGADDDPRDPETIRRIRRVDAQTLRVTTVAGDPGAATAEDGAALATRLDFPHALALADADTIYVAERTRIRRLSLGSGTLATVAGNGAEESSGDGVPALDAGIYNAMALAVDAAGDLFVADRKLKAIRRIRFGAGGATIDTVVGLVQGGAPIEGAALASPMPNPQGLAVAPDGSLVIAEVQTSSIVRVSRPDPADKKTWTLSKVAGGYADLDSIADSPASTVRLSTNNLAARGDQLYFSDVERHVVWQLDQSHPEDPLSWRLRRVAGGGDQAGEGVCADQAALDLGFKEGPLAFDSDGALYIGATGEHRVRRVVFDPADPTCARIATVAGTGAADDTGDGGKALDAALNVTALAFDTQGRLFVAGGNRVRRINRVDPADPATWTIEAAVGTGAIGYGGDGGPALAATFEWIWGIAASPTHLFVSDPDGFRVRAVTLTGEPKDWTVFGVAGDGTAGFLGDGGKAQAARLAYPTGIAWDAASSSLLVTDKDNDAVRRVTVSGADPAAWTIETIHDPAHTDDPFYGDGGPLSAARFHRPVELALGGGGALYLDMYESVRRVDPVTKAVTTIMGGVDPAGDGKLLGGGLGSPRALARIATGHFAIADGGTGRVRLVVVDPALGEVRTVAGYPGGRPGAGPARYSRLLEEAAGVAWDEASRSLFVSEENGHALRRLRIPADALETPWTWTIEDFAGQRGTAGHVDGTLAASRFAGPSGLAFDAATRTLYVAESRSHDVRAVRVDAPESPDCVATVAGVPGHLGFFEGPAAKDAFFHGPTALALDGQGGLYVADTGNHRVRRLDLAAETVRTVLGTGHGASSGEGSPATSFPVDSPSGLAVDSKGNLFVTSRDSVREVTRSGQGGAESGLGRVFSVHGPETAGDLALPTRCLTGLLLDGDASFYALDQCQGALLKFARK